MATVDVSCPDLGCQPPFALAEIDPKLLALWPNTASEGKAEGHSWRKAKSRGIMVSALKPYNRISSLEAAHTSWQYHLRPARR